VEKFNVVLFSKSVSRWIFAYALFAFDNVFFKNKKHGKNKKKKTLKT